jgi:(1->4)-alpha-D-glucan 1-alpha-D-glucosylmutase
MKIPVSTYRLQLNHQFRFENISEIIDYLHKLGINFVYASPIFKAKKGSMHGYDIVDPQQLNPELGSYEEFDEVIECLHKHNMGWLQDIVPNHMSYNQENQMLIDLLENGNNSRYYDFFDIEWNHPHASIGQRIMAPFLGKYYQQCLESGELKLRFDQEGFSINYYEFRLPIRMESYPEILTFRLNQIVNKMGRNNPDIIKYQGILYTLKSLPDAENIDERYEQIKFIKAMLWELYSHNEDIKVFIDETLKIYNGEPGNPESYNPLDQLLVNQYFRLCFWKVATEEINYRRFFNINELISLRMENEEAFARTHSFILKLIKENKINGLRIDHIDGLYDPAEYIERLRARSKKVYLVVEKILELEEKLPENWQVDGTTGYEYLNYVTQLFCSSANKTIMTSIYNKFTRLNIPFEELMYQKKNLIIKTRMAGEVERLAFIVESVSSTDRYGIDITMHALKQALDEVLTYFPVYRTYINKTDFSEQDKKYIDEVTEKAIQSNPRFSNEINYVCNLLKLKFGDHFSEYQKEKALDFVMRFQQLTGPLMAKGFEDTVLYVYNRLISLNEVGGNPGVFGNPVKQFHEFNKERVKKWKYTLNASSSHDTKRSEDVRARINVLSEIPKEWEGKLKSWHKMNIIHKQEINGKRMPDRNDEYFLYQTLLGSFPFDEKELEGYSKRIQEYIIKSVREAKVYTAWIKHDEAYENAYLQFVAKILTPSDDNHFYNDLISFHKKVSHYGIINSLSQQLLKITSPGVPDFYQGTELWDFSLVDPDNRRPVDYNLRKKYLDEMRSLKEDDIKGYISKLLDEKENGKLKLFLTYRALLCRNQNSELFSEGDYLPLEIEGDKKDNIAAYARVLEKKMIVTVVPRFAVGLCDQESFPLGENVWGETSVILPGKVSSIINEITCEKIEPAEKIKAAGIFNQFPAALLNCDL